ncbi:LpqB family beta-propeller domain-containing protein [Streptomyces sp. H27-H1]|uniref:LpqB family beta-propeller domain-containing protein n=1 Tax=Streptomyces sp. H27-H1 TaxID=2996461 RepID=UPI00226FA98D|nr:LpqB family beta-propeller domain-containing protein [Streptomyces sp. H27-H1]MCY0932004.1 LpqB family beta-propeller domain-containing protein [Streptomyces sp. H27-H1]
MGADPGRSRWRTPRTLRTCAFGAAGLLLAGCASMPDHGEIRPVEASQGVDSQVRVFGVPPADRASPQEIVDGFLEAMTSDDPQLQTARKYLTEEAANNWKPGAAVTVLSSGLDRFSVQGEKDPMAPRFKVAGKMLATVDERSAYQPETGDRRYEEFLQLTQDKNKQWRIATPPSSLVLSESDFQRIYMPVNKYYFAGGTLVADPVYVRQRNDPDSRMDPTTQTVTSLLAGPSKWLGPVVTSSFPTGTQLSEGTKSLSYDGQNTLRVPLNSKANDVAQPQCQRMATQLLYTVKDLTGSRVDRVELIHSDGKSSLCGVSEAAAAVIANRPLSPGHQYYVDEEDRLQRLSLDPNREEQQDPPTPVPGPLSGNPAFKVGSAAIAYDEKRAAVVSEDGHGLYVVNLTTAGQMPQPVLTGKGAKPNGLTTPTWDAAGDLWVADPDPQNAALWRLPGGTGTRERVEVSGLDGGRITGLKASPDGVRMALLVQRESRSYLYIGRIERPDAKGDVSAVSVRELRPAAPQLADVTALSWAPRGRLLVVGRESGGIVQARYMLADGSMVGAGLPGAAGLVAVTASEDEKKPVVASSLEDGIVWLPPGAQWRTVVAGGRAPIYPG